MVTRLWLAAIWTRPSSWLHTSTAFSVNKRISTPHKVNRLTPNDHGPAGCLDLQVPPGVQAHPVRCQLDKAAVFVFDPDALAAVIEPQPLAAGCLQRVAAHGPALQSRVGRAGHAIETPEDHALGGVLLREQDQDLVADVGQRRQTLAGPACRRPHAQPR